VEGSDINKKVYDLLKKAKAKEKKRRRSDHKAKSILIITAVLVAAGTAYGAYALLTAPAGRITSPAEASQTPRIVEISGYTKNILRNADTSG